MKLMTSLLLLGLCGLYGTLSTTEAAAVTPGTTKANHGPAVISEKSGSVPEKNTPKLNDNHKAGIQAIDAAVTPSPDSELTTANNVSRNEINGTTLEFTNTTTDTNTTFDAHTTIDTNTLTDASNNINTTVKSSTGSVQAGGTHTADTASTHSSTVPQSTSRSAHESVGHQDNSISEAV